MRINLPQALKSGEKVSFSIKWWYNIPDHTVNRARSGYEYFEKDGNRAYVIAQFFPRMAVYSDEEGWQNHQFWGSGKRFIGQNQNLVVQSHQCTGLRFCNFS